jgi:hypothetical protein
MFEVEIRVAGAVDQTWVSGGMPGFTADLAPGASIIRGVLAPGEHLSAILNVLARHGVVPFDVWVHSFGSETDRRGESPAGEQRRAGGRVRDPE